LPGFFLSSAISSPTFFTPSDGLTTSAFGARMICVIGAKSFSRS
jgi:hypothetical protein